jgi:hypothetical protein
MSDQDAIDLSVFDPKVLKRAVAALVNQPILDRYQILKNDQAFEVAKVRLQEIWDIYTPLLETYIALRRKQDKTYESETDPTLEKLRKSVSTRTDKLLEELEKRHTIRMQISAARVARAQLHSMLNETEKILDLYTRSVEIERSTYLPPSVDTENN